MHPIPHLTHGSLDMFSALARFTLGPLLLLCVCEGRLEISGDRTRPSYCVLLDGLQHRGFELGRLGVVREKLVHDPRGIVHDQLLVTEANGELLR